MKQLILASGSPRRKELLGMLGFDFEVIVSKVDEVVDEHLTPEEIVKSLALQKAQDVFKDHKDAVVLGSDTIVVVGNEILGKPHSEKQAKDMMKKLSGCSHKVITGVAIINGDEIVNFADEAEVFFDEMDEEEIEKYILTKEPYDKAGGYAIQGWAGKYINRIEGSYYTIVGLPVSRVYQSLKKML